MDRWTGNPVGSVGFSGFSLLHTGWVPRLAGLGGRRVETAQGS